jgi:hypothetical protein
MSLAKDAGLFGLSKTIGCRMAQAPDLLTTALNRATKLNPKIFYVRETCIEYFRGLDSTATKAWDARFAEATDIEGALTEFLEPASDTLKGLREDAVGQLSFQVDGLRGLNYVPFALTLVAIFKIWAVPALAVLTPLLAWILPYIFLKFMYRLPISGDQYTAILQSLWAGAPIQFRPGADGLPTASLPSLWTPRSIFQGILFVGSFLQSLIQPIQNAMHLWRTDQTVLEQGRRAIRLHAIYRDVVAEVEHFAPSFQFRESLDDLATDDPRQAIHLLLEQPTRATIAFRDLADLEILWRMARCERLRPVSIVEGDTPLFQAANMADLSLPTGVAVPSTVEFTGSSHHAALTGPNGGGKSSFLRSVLQCVLLGQAYGVAPAERVIMRRFHWISSGLRLQDSPGELSMFETEVWFAAALLEREGVGLVLYDELFHSTNPPDGIETARIFLDRLWAKKQVLSVVSTHVFDLVEAAPAEVQRLCCEATEEGGRIQYGYSVGEGICRISSVRSIWERFGLAPREPAAPENLAAKEK